MASDPSLRAPPPRLPPAPLRRLLVANLTTAMARARARGLASFADVTVRCGEQPFRVDLALVARAVLDAERNLVDPLAVILIGTAADTAPRVVMARAGTSMREVWRLDLVLDRIVTQTRVPGGWLRLVHGRGEQLPGRLVGFRLAVDTLYRGAGG